MFTVFPCSHDVGSECDSPFSLTNHTLDFIDKKWSANIDFVVCMSPPFHSIPYLPSSSPFRISDRDTRNLVLVRMVSMGS